jgi:cysteine desulfurase/selenocysteine lyase
LIPVPWDTTNWDDFITPEVSVVAIHHVSHVFGTILPVELIRDSMRKICPDAILVLDACQSVPHLPIDVKEVGCDVLVASGHKMFGPTGVGFMYMNSRAQEKVRPSSFGGGSVSDIINDDLMLTEFPHCFEPGTPAVAETIGLAAACTFLSEFSQRDELIFLLESEVSKIPGCRILTDGNPRVIPLISFVINGVSSEDISRLIDSKSKVCMRSGNHCAAPLHRALGLTGGSLRMSCQVYNDKTEVLNMNQCNKHQKQ